MEKGPEVENEAQQGEAAQYTQTRIPGCLKLTASTWGSKVGATPKAEEKEAFSIHWVLLRQFELLEEFQHTNVSRAALNQQCSSTRHHGAQIFLVCVNISLEE